MADDTTERPVPTTDERQKPELVTLHLYRDTCVGGLFLSERELDRTLHGHVETLTIRRDRLPAPSVPTREQIAALSEEEAMNLWWEACNDGWAVPDDLPKRYLSHVLWALALIQNGTDR